MVWARVGDIHVCGLRSGTIESRAATATSSVTSSWDMLVRVAVKQGTSQEASPDLPKVLVLPRELYRPLPNNSPPVSQSVIGEPPGWKKNP